MLNDLYHALDPVAFWIGPFAIRWYGLGYLFGLLLGGWLILHTARRWRLSFSLDALLSVLVASAFGIIVGARLGYALFYGGDYYFSHPAEIITGIASGGMSFHGGLLGMVIAMVVVARVTRMPLLTLGDLIVIAAPIGIFLVRIANFINGELWGAPTDLPWGVIFSDTGGGTVPRHPSQLYEAALEGAVMFVILNILALKQPPRPRGSFLGLFLLLYGVFRVLVEFVRQPDAQIGYLFGDWLTMGMLLSAPMIVAGIAFLLFAHRKRLPQQGLPQLEEASDSSKV
ncbi:MAG: prolipoprotein diacylglyceryl transferase [Coriobacteriales bacterium]|jgi:phosphatidylglycerol:prolipoprotein diacylglycerol transferase|nr:prolipoprotein diacylglyceryl transferase [Coriobacteriales bacterium]